MKRSIKEIALELLEKYQDKAESVGTLADVADLAEEIRRYRKEIEEADHEPR